LHGVLEIVPQHPDLIVSGINYGENVGSGVTVSGTVGAALEGAAVGVPALAISLETAEEHHLSYSPDVDFSVAAHFTEYFARLLLSKNLPPDVHVLKVEVPSDASPETPWRATRLSMHRYFEPVISPERNWSEPGGIGYRRQQDRDQAPEGTDVNALVNQRVVSVTPLSLDLTSRVDLSELEGLLRVVDGSVG
jgi:5'-nucleotidase